MTKLHLFIAVSEVISIFLLFRLWRKPDYMVFKILISAITLIPFLGPILYFFMTDKTKAQSVEMQNNGPRGSYTHKKISIDETIKGGSNKGGDSNGGP